MLAATLHAAVCIAVVFLSSCSALPDIYVPESAVEKGIEWGQLEWGGPYHPHYNNCLHRATLYCRHLRQKGIQARIVVGENPYTRQTANLLHAWVEVFKAASPSSDCGTIHLIDLTGADDGWPVGTYGAGRVETDYDRYYPGWSPRYRLAVEAGEDRWYAYGASEKLRPVPAGGR
jgi:hypothetical protein